MFKFEITDPKEARRFRIAQFNGRTVTAGPAEAAVTGHVRSIVENKSHIPTVWIVTVVPEASRSTGLVHASGD
jgi:hypothetical protein